MPIATRPLDPDLLTNEVMARIVAKVQREKDTGCWVWTAACRSGYGQFQLAGKP